MWNFAKIIQQGNLDLNLWFWNLTSERFKMGFWISVVNSVTRFRNLDSKFKPRFLHPDWKRKNDSWHKNFHYLSGLLISNWIWLLRQPSKWQSSTILRKRKPNHWVLVSPQPGNHQQAYSFKFRSQKDQE